MTTGIQFMLDISCDAPETPAAGGYGLWYRSVDTSGNVLDTTFFQGGGGYEGAMPRRCDTSRHFRAWEPADHSRSRIPVHVPAIRVQFYWSRQGGFTDFVMEGDNWVFGQPLPPPIQIIIPVDWRRPP
jgi:hypothetical protein